MKTITQSLIRFAAIAIASFTVSGAFALAQGASEFDTLSSDPLADFFADEEDIDTSGMTLGANNNAVIVQRGQAGNHLELEQDGDRNLMISSQKSYADANRARAVQAGNENMSFLRQYGDNNEYDLLQTGDKNVSAATQYGDNNTFEHVQNGNNLGFAVTQYGDSAIKVTQTGN